MIRYAATSTDVRKQKIMDILRQIDYNRSETVQGFGLNVDNNFTEVDARILKPPQLQYGNNARIIPRDGVWRPDGKQFITPMGAMKWAFLKIDFRTQRNALQSLGQMVNIILICCH